jgi:hypothetical protein
MTSIVQELIIGILICRKLGLKRAATHVQATRNARRSRM